MKLTPLAKKIWDQVPAEMRLTLLNTVWCSKCMTSRGMAVETGEKRKHGLVLRGKCLTCGYSVCRVVDID